MWLGIVLLIPITMIIVIVSILMFAGYDVGSWMKAKASETPIVANLVPDEQNDELEAELEKADETIALQQDEISDLEKEVASLEDIVDDQKLDITKLENRNSSTDGLEDGVEIEEVDDIKQAAASFRKMDAKKAASIVQNLEENVAIHILVELSGDVRGAILAEWNRNKLLN